MKRAVSTSSQGFVPFASMGAEPQQTIVVNVVMVPPAGTGTAYGHTESDVCVQFTNATKAMLALFHELRAAGREVPPRTVSVDAGEWKDVRAIDRAECPIHMLPEIPPGSAVAFAPY
ncbi:MAG TPA: hypothetical protein VGN11_12765 [Candidatus Baltobacteraceae bacterium]|jgi:hypothetical protein|nr:hypothetical protein [Candidatus Baltobacteraceae bacterium]